MAVPEGMIQIVCYDNREDSKTKGNILSITFGVDDYKLIKIPPNIWYAFKAISETHAIIANCTTAPHDPNESETLPLDTKTIPYIWS